MMEKHGTPHGDSSRGRPPKLRLMSTGSVYNSLGESSGCYSPGFDTARVSQTHLWEEYRQESDSSGSDDVADRSPQHRGTKSRRCRDDDDDEMRSYKVQVVRNLLKNFSLEDTIESYRDSSAKSFKLNPLEFSYSSTMAANNLKQKLLRYTGSDEVRMNDARYMTRIGDQVQKDYEADLLKRERARAEEERQRLRNLLAKGLLSPASYKRECRLLYGEIEARPYTTSNSKSWTGRTRKTKNSTRRKKSSPDRSKSASHAEDRKAKRRIHFSSAKPVRTPPQGAMRMRNGHSACSTGSRSSACTLDYLMSRDSRPSAHDADSNFSEISSTGVDKDSLASIEEDSRAGPAQEWRLNRRRSPKPILFAKYEHPVVREMKDEQTVEGLYRLADMVITPKLEKGLEEGNCIKH